MAASVGSTAPRTGLRPIIIDGSNVAFLHGRHQQFSIKGRGLYIGKYPPPPLGGGKKYGLRAMGGKNMEKTMRGAKKRKKRRRKKEQFSKR
jgi:hypothetical protein